MSQTYSIGELTLTKSQIPMPATVIYMDGFQLSMLYCFFFCCWDVLCCRYAAGPALYAPDSLVLKFVVFFFCYVLFPTFLLMLFCRCGCGTIDCCQWVVSRMCAKRGPSASRGLLCCVWGLRGAGEKFAAARKYRGCRVKMGKLSRLFVFENILRMIITQHCYSTAIVTRVDVIVLLFPGKLQDSCFRQRHCCWVRVFVQEKNLPECHTRLTRSCWIRFAVSPSYIECAKRCVL